LPSISISLEWDIIKKADEIANKHKIPGVNNRSGLIDYALKKVFKEIDLEQRQNK